MCSSAVAAAEGARGALVQYVFSMSSSFVIPGAETELRDLATFGTVGYWPVAGAGDGFEPVDGNQWSSGVCVQAHTQTSGHVNS